MDYISQKSKLPYVFVWIALAGAHWNVFFGRKMQNVQALIFCYKINYMFFWTYDWSRLKMWWISLGLDRPCTAKSVSSLEWPWLKDKQYPSKPEMNKLIGLWSRPDFHFLPNIPPKCKRKYFLSACTGHRKLEGFLKCVMVGWEDNSRCKLV